MRKQKFFSLFVLLLIIGSNILLLSGCSTKEIPIPQAESNVYVYDDDNLFSEYVINQLNSMLINLEKETSVEFAVVTVKSLLDNSIEHYSITVANGMGIGKKETNNGVLLIMSRSDKRVRLEIGKGLEGILNDAKCGRILDKFFVPYRNQDGYAEGTILTVQAVINEIAIDAGVTIEGVNSSIVVPEPMSTALILLIIVIIIIVIILLFLFLDHVTDGAISHSISSGGGSSGGGFGGGGFGGGGASR